ncbi:MAG: DUF501 domain-containing protein [Propionibacteriaceae bacterium]
MLEDFTEADQTAVTAQLGRVPRGTVGVAWRCPCGKPGVVATSPRLPDGTPFPTTFYLTCPRAASAISTLEAGQVMVDMQERMAADPQLQAEYQRAHEAYLADRAEVGRKAGVGDVPEIAKVTAGGMPTRVKCLHALAGHALAAGPGVNPWGDEAVAAIGEFWCRPCKGEDEQQ